VELVVLNMEGSFEEVDGVKEQGGKTFLKAFDSAEHIFQMG
jgi:hypothetical protein